MEPNISTPQHKRLIRASHTIPEAAASVRLDTYAAEVFDLLPSRKAAKKAAERGDLLIDGEPAAPNQAVRPGQTLELLDSDRPPPPAYDLPLTIVFEDDWLAVIEKPAGIPVSGNYPRTVRRALLANLAVSPLPDALPWPHPVHRLDAPTGGLLMIAKTAAAMVELSRLFQTRNVQKRYRAIVAGRLDSSGTVNEDLDGRPAETEYRPVEHTRSLHTDWITTVDLWPHTGRTHQLRRHLAGLGHPIAGDQQYGQSGHVLKGKGLFLWAVELAFRHPFTQEDLRLTVTEPPKFETYRHREARRWETFSEI